MAASKTIMNVTAHGKSIDIYFNKLEHDYNKQLITVNKPISSGSGGTNQDDDTLNIDLGRLGQVVSITNGWLLDESGSSAYSKLQDLDSITRQKGTVTFSWKMDDAGTERTITKEGNIMKWKVTETPERIGDTTQVLNGTQTKTLMINIQFSVGKHIG